MQGGACAPPLFEIMLCTVVIRLGKTSSQQCNSDMSVDETQ